MNIQAAVIACKRNKQLLARPSKWEGSGTALDLGRIMYPDRVRKIAVLTTGNAFSESWMCDPEDLLGEWKVVSLNKLVEEVNSLDSKEGRAAGAS